MALGGNVARPGQEVASTLGAALEAMPVEGVEVLRRSRVWRSAAWPDPAEPPFLNAVAMVGTALGPDRLLEVLHRIEARLGRVRDLANAPRPIDLDLIAYGREVRAGALVLPHPRAAERLFVMGPLAEIAPEWRHPVDGRSARELAAAATVGRDATPFQADGGLQTRGGSLI